MSSRFRDLEKPLPEKRKDIVLMAAVSGFESLTRPARQDLVQFSALFPKLFENASTQAQRTAAAALSRVALVPDEVAELIIDQPIEIAAPFISHYVGLPETTLCRAIMRHGVGHARAAARRIDLSPTALAALWALKEPVVDRALALRGLTLETQFAAEIAVPGQSAQAAPLSPTRASTGVERQQVQAPPLARLDELNGTDTASEGLRDHLRGLVALDGRDTGMVDMRRRSDRQPAGPGLRAGRVAGLLDSHRAFASDAARRSVTRRQHLARLARFAGTGDANWFATALADAMGSSFALAERIMLDLSGVQLATTLMALGSEEPVIVTALATYFPHLAGLEDGRSKAEGVIAALVADECEVRLAAWQRADAYTLHRPLDELDSEEGVEDTANGNIPPFGKRRSA